VQQSEAWDEDEDSGLGEEDAPLLSDYEPARADLRRALRQEPNPVIWRQLVDEQYAQEYVDHRITCAALVETYRKRLQDAKDAAAAETGRKAVSGETGDVDARARWQALGQLLWREASEWSPVVAFRHRHLRQWQPLHILPPDGSVTATQWIRAKAQEEGPHTLLATVPLPSDLAAECTPGSPPLVVTLPVRLDPERCQCLRLEWWDRDSEMRLSTPFVAGGVLHELARTAQEVARVFGFDEAKAATFVLDGKPVGPVRARYVAEPIDSPKHPRWHIRLDVDPSVSAREVADLYRQARRAAKLRKERAFSARILELLRFASTLRSQGTSWEEARRLWKQRRGDRDRWSDDADRMSRDYHRARKALLTAYGPGSRFELKPAPSATAGTSTGAVAVSEGGNDDGTR
jgi:hypothetical protein